jgi:hypothetical protein
MKESEKIKKFKVLANFTYDKFYNRGDAIELSDKKVIQVLINNKFIA